MDLLPTTATDKSVSKNLGETEGKGKAVSERFASDSNEVFELGKYPPFGRAVCAFKPHNGAIERVFLPISHPYQRRQLCHKSLQFYSC